MSALCHLPNIVLFSISIETLLILSFGNTFFVCLLFFLFFFFLFFYEICVLDSQTGSGAPGEPQFDCSFIQWPESWSKQVTWCVDVAFVLMIHLRNSFSIHVTYFWCLLSVQSTSVTVSFYAWFHVWTSHD